MPFQRFNLTIWSAAIANCIVVLVTLRTQGWSLVGLHAAARNSARFSGMCFVIAFAAPGLTRFVRSLPSGTTLLWAWFAAHLVHFAIVTVLLGTFGRAQVTEHPGRNALTVVGGSTLVFSVALTAAAHSRLRKMTHTLLLYVVFVIFTAAFAHDRVVWFRVLVVPLVLALATRLSARFRLEERKVTPPV